MWYWAVLKIKPTCMIRTCKCIIRNDSSMLMLILHFQKFGHGMHFVVVCFRPVLSISFRVHYSDVIMGMVTFQITSLMIVYSTIYLGADQRKHQSSTSLAFARGIHRWPVNSPHKWPVTRRIFPFYDVIMSLHQHWCNHMIASLPLP